MRELSFSLVTVRALCSGVWAHTHKSYDRHAPLHCMIQNSMGDLNRAGTGDRTGNSRDSSCEEITGDEGWSWARFKALGPCPRGLATFVVSSLVFPELHPFLHSCQS